MKTLSLLFGGAVLVSATAAISPSVSAAQTLYKPFPADVMPSLSEKGNYDVGVKTIEAAYPAKVKDIAGNEVERSLTLEVWYPAASSAQKATYINETRSGQVFEVQADASRDAPIAAADTDFPVIVISHGYTGYRTLMFYLGEHLASHGYVVAAIDHTDSTNKDVNFAENPYSGFPSTLLNRSRDQVLTLNSISENTFFKESVDASKAGVIGYSMGGYGAVSTVGGCYAFNDQTAATFTGTQDPKTAALIKEALNTCAGGKASSEEALPAWKAALALAPWGGQHQLFDVQSLNNIKVPVLYVAGDNDDISGYDGIKWLFDNTGSKESKLLTIKNARHNVAPHPAPKEAYGSEFDLGSYIEPAWEVQKLNAINEHFALALMNCHVKALPEYCGYLNVDGSSAQVPVNGKKPEPWKGFDDRWALGLEMQSK
ncbi:dienelactone hydrolase family protein [Alteromonas sp. Cnat2-8]|uniref:alpha/beta hydrolase family protein n=1 Tax=Alteromonas sp. Cnat2-8 TaxID=2917728 RepID=UPI001EF4F669|nr:dienelactone hydrolase family protein [Alteromonas sp. Cnat2-8]MCG7655487.1 dienelactone hydrolase family protein [Alteromonas sp. Cnat2-8]MCS5575839.1 dienelactone hydrolase family protein [Alteromonas macleodii]